MSVQEIDLRRLVIKAFHMNDVEMGDHNSVGYNGMMTVSKEIIPSLLEKYETLDNIDIQVIKPGDHDRWTNTLAYI